MQFLFFSFQKICARTLFKKIDIWKLCKRFHKLIIKEILVIVTPEFSYLKCSMTELTYFFITRKMPPLLLNCKSVIANINLNNKILNIFNFPRFAENNKFLITEFYNYCLHVPIDICLHIQDILFHLHISWSMGVIMISVYK